MNAVAAVIQARLRVATGGLETCVWSTNKFVISSVSTLITSAITVTSKYAAGTGTDISGATTTTSNFMFANTGN
jgi:hypothetical protein